MIFLVPYLGSLLSMKSLAFQLVTQDYFLNYFPFLAFFPCQEAKEDLSRGLWQAKDGDDVPFLFHFIASSIYCLLRKYTSWLSSSKNTNRSTPQKKMVVAEIQYL